MPRFSANLNFLFNEVAFMERFAAAAKAGFKYVEFMFPYDFDQKEIQKQLVEHNLQIVLFNLPAGNWGEGDRGLAADPKRKEEFINGIDKAIEAATLFGVSRVNCLAGKVNGVYEEAEVMDNLIDNISLAADALQNADIKLLIEPINHFDIPGFYLNTTEQVVEIINKLNRPNIYLQYDIYHAERESEDHEKILREYFKYIDHVQIADNPGRNEPGTGVIDVKHLFDTLDQLGFNGYVGMEYKPSGNTLDSLEWVEKLGYKL